MDAGFAALALQQRAGGAMNPLSAAYGAVIAARNALYDRGSLRTHRLQHAVISIGNLRVGGTGKTPFTIALGELLQQRKMAFDVLSRGYGRESRGARLVNPKGDASQFGDEPLLITRKLEVPVIVGEHRVTAGRYAEQLFSGVQPAHGEWLHLLDDGFQHRRLAREFDIVLLSASDFEDALLPVGRLREPLSSLRRADAVVLPHDVATDAPEIRGKDIWRVRRKLGVPHAGLPPSAIVFCGIARPQQFFADIRSLGCQVRTEVAFRDHHNYNLGDIDRLRALGDQHNAEGFITTEKDLVRLGLFAPQLQPLSTIELKLEIEDADERLDSMLAVVEERLRSRHTH
jgi:tetraacyldisaccharide 4'-kinase